MELPSKIAALLQEGETLVIRGDGTDSAVLCTSNMTFDLKEAETSNSLLVVDGLYYPDKNSKGNVFWFHIKVHQVINLITFQTPINFEKLELKRSKGYFIDTWSYVSVSQGCQNLEHFWTKTYTEVVIQLKVV